VVFIVVQTIWLEAVNWRSSEVTWQWPTVTIRSQWCRRPTLRS